MTNLADITHTNPTSNTIAALRSSRAFTLARFFIVVFIIITEWMIASSAVSASALPAHPHQPIIADVSDSNPQQSIETETVIETVIETDLQNDTRIQGRVWLDLNRNGLQNTGEQGVSGIVINLVEPRSQAVLQRSTSDANGLYSFAVSPGNYRVEFEVSAGVITIANVGENPQLDSDAMPSTSTSNLFVQTDEFAVSEGEQTVGWDVGLLPANIKGRAWLDVNENGLQDETPLMPVADIPVHLAVAANNQTQITIQQTTQTDAQGIYTFTAQPNSYVVFFDLPLDILTPSNQDGPLGDAGDSDAYHEAGTGENPGEYYGQTPLIQVTFGSVTSNHDAGIRPSVIGDRVWLDINRDGIQDDATTGEIGLGTEVSEPGAPIIPVKLYNAQNQLLAETLTTPTGHYSFTVAPGVYQLALDVPEEALPKVDVITSDDALAFISTDALTIGHTLPFTIALGENNLSLDVGLYPALIQGVVWDDLNGNGIREQSINVSLVAEPDDQAEPGLGHVKVALLDHHTGQTILESASDFNGEYTLATIPGLYDIAFTQPENYLFSVVAATQDPQPSSPENSGPDTPSRPSNIVTSDVNPDTGRIMSVTVAYNQTYAGWDAGMYAGATLGDFIWADDNGNGLFDEDESQIADVVVRLYSEPDAQSGNNLTGVLRAISRSDDQGAYRFTQMSPGRYYITVEPPVNQEYVLTRNRSGLLTFASTTETPSEIQTEIQAGAQSSIVESSPQMRSNTFTVTSGLEDFSLDLGMAQPAAIHTYLWYDQNRNGVRNGDELGAGGVTGKLYNDFNRLIAQATSTPTGTLSFVKVPPGIYQLEFDAAVGLGFTSQGQTSNEQQDSDIDPFTGRTRLFQLQPGEVNVEWGAGVVIPRELIDVWDFAASETVVVSSTESNIEDESSVPSQTAIALTWHTSDYIASSGFRLYRNTVLDRANASVVDASIMVQESNGQVNPAEPLPGNTPDSVSYRYQTIDPIAEPAHYYYWLVDIENGFEVNERGPIELDVVTVIVDESNTDVSDQLPDGVLEPSSDVNPGQQGAGSRVFIYLPMIAQD
ncbi:MAG: SdrD B-like domain-containing protein [Chloroflexota bacterium]